MEVWEEENKVVNMERDKKYMYMIKIMRKELCILKHFQGEGKRCQRVLLYIKPAVGEGREERGE